jgi:4-hydroxy-tetrahydrodipicolinate reductase
MRIAVVGYGRMGHEVEAVLRDRGHEPIIVDRDIPGFPEACPVGIDFTRSDAVVANARAALEKGSRYVIGTTGWGDQEGELKALVERHQGGIVHAANFALGVNLFYKIVREAASLLSLFPDYDPYVLERHHRQKKDAPSGTAKVLARIVAESGGPRRAPAMEVQGGLPDEQFHVSSVRAGGIVGEHTVGFDSGGDEILLEHRTRNRRGFALGAVLAAEWIAPRRGFHSFEAVLDDLAAG